jgi:hypothetical protein
VGDVCVMWSNLVLCMWKWQYLCAHKVFVVVVVVVVFVVVHLVKI